MHDSEILILGGNGQLGTALRQQYPGARAVDSAELDITNTTALSAFDWSGVNYVLNAAAYTDVDGAETAKGRIAAWRVNGTGSANLAVAANAHSFTLVHVSTDYVFDGTADSHNETEPLSPLGVYGQSKAAGDLVVGSTSKHYILRTSWVIGEGKNFVRTMVGLGQKGIAPTVVADQFGRLTFANELVRAIDHLLTTEAAYGTYNVSNSGDVISWADITREIFKIGGFNQTVSNTTTEAYFASKENIAPRPLNSTFDLSKIEQTGLTLTDWHNDLKTYVEKELAA